MDASCAIQEHIHLKLCGIVCLINMSRILGTYQSILPVFLTLGNGGQDAVKFLPVDRLIWSFAVRRVNQTY